MVGKSPFVLPFFVCVYLCFGLVFFSFSGPLYYIYSNERSKAWMKIENQKRYHPIRALTAANRGIGIQILLVANYALENVIVFVITV